MKIGIITEIISFHSGARAPLELAKHLAKQGHDISVYGYDFGTDGSAKLDLKAHSVRVLIFKKPHPHPSLIGRIIAAVSLFKNLRRDNPDVIIFAGTISFFLEARLTGIPIIQIYMGTQFDALLENTIPNQGILFIVKAFNAVLNVCIYLVGFIIYRLSTELVAISKYAAHEGKHLYKKNANMIIYLGTTFFQKYNTKTLRKKDYISLLSISRITPYKGFHLIIEAIRAVKTKKNINLIIAGSQPKQNYVEYLKKIGGNSVNIIIDPSDTILSNLYQQSNIYVCADRYLYFGLPIFEAAQFGKPTVSLNFAAAHELIEHGKTGFVANNLDEFANFLQKLIEDEKLRKKLGLNALQWAKTFSWEKCAREWEKILYKYAKQP